LLHQRQRHIVKIGELVRDSRACAIVGMDDDLLVSYDRIERDPMIA
jgi:hypothetical protein